MADVYKKWDLLTVDNKPYTLGVLTDATLWLQWTNLDGTKVNVQLDPASHSVAVNEALTALAEVKAANATCTVTFVVLSGSYTLRCDLPNGHRMPVHHDPGTNIYWQRDATF